MYMYSAVVTHIYVLHILQSATIFFYLKATRITLSICL